MSFKVRLTASSSASKLNVELHDFCVPPCISQLLHVTAELGILQETVIVGGLEMQQQARALARRPHVVVATPGRLKVLHQRMS